MREKRALKDEAGVKKTETYHYAPQVSLARDGLIRAAAYCRVSTLLEEQELSFDTQCAYYNKLLADTTKFQIVGIYGDDGLSGLKAANRPEFMRLIQDSMDGKIDRIYVKSISRFSRNMSECLEYIRLLKKKGVVVCFEKEHVSTDDEQLEMILGLYASIAQADSCTQSESLKWTITHRAEQGDPVQKACYGYKKASKVPGQIREWVIVEEEAERIRLAFDMADRGCTYHAILDALNRLEQRKGTGVEWKYPRMYLLLRRIAYKGDLLTNRYFVADYVTKRYLLNRGERPQFYIEDHHPAIVPREQFDRVARLINNRALYDNMLPEERRRRYEEVLNCPAPVDDSYELGANT